MSLELGSMVWDADVHLWVFSSSLPFKVMGLDAFTEAICMDRGKEENVGLRLV